MNNNIKKYIVSIGMPSSKINVLPPFIDIEKFNPKHRSVKIRQKFGALSDEPIIIYVGNLKYSKGLDLLIEALGMLVKKYLFWFIYTLELKDKSFERNLEKITDNIQKNGLSGCTSTLGIISFMPALMASCDLIVIPYRNTDGPSDYPIALIEAMASGIPAAATRVGGIPELLEDNFTGILMEPENKHELATAIEKMITNPIYRKELGRNARERCCEMLKNKNISTGILTIYNQLGEDNDFREF
jgi:glycosyltransferase involved in cell wall biosynthesis